MPKPIRSVLINGGQGDCVMGAIGLDAMLSLAPQAFAPDLTVYTRTYIAPVIQALLPQLPVKLLDEARQAQRPKYYPSSHMSGSTVLRNLFGQDYYVSYNASRERGSHGQASYGWVRDCFHRWSERCLFKRTDWQAYTPAYYGQLMWMPLAVAAGCNGMDLQRVLHGNFASLRAKLLAVPQLAGVAGAHRGVAFFPVGRAFQTQPPGFVRRLVDALSLEQYCCYFPAQEPRREAYEAEGLRCETANEPWALLRAMVQSAVVVTSDSLSSHLAQLVAPRHVALMSHDLPTHTLHPAATTAPVFEAMPCVPCTYVGMSDSDQCAAGRRNCGVFDSPAYFERAVLLVGGGR